MEAGTGAPDICDVEAGQFPNVVAGLDKWLVPLDDYAKDYMPTMVPARMQTYQGADGHYYGAPYHVGATTMYYNVAAMSEAMGLSQEEVIAKIDAVKTWDQYEALGKEYLTALGGGRLIMKRQIKNIFLILPGELLGLFLEQAVS